MCQAHAFVDGNKRIAAAACLGFLRLEGFDLQVTNETIIEIFLQIAASEMSREQLETFLRQRTAPLSE